MGTQNERGLASTFARDLTMQCFDESGRAHRLTTVFSYDAADPYAVTVTFVTPGGTLPWILGRDLLMTGLNATAGVGDVRVRPGRDDRGDDTVELEFTSPDGHLLTRARADDVAAFLAHTVVLVPPGQESRHVDVDGLVDHLLAT